MAPTARKDVELIIRAKDQATRAVDAITKAITNMASATDDLVPNAEKTENAFGRIGSAVNKLERVFRDLSVDSTLTKQLDSATSASDRLEKSMAETAAESRRLATELERTTASASELNAKTAEAAESVKRQAKAAADARDQQKGLNATLKEATDARDTLMRAEERLGKKIAEQQARVDTARQRFAELSKTMAETAEPTATFVNRVESAGKSLAKAETRLGTLTAQLEENQAAIVASNTSIGTFQARLGDIENKVQEANKALADGRAEYKALGDAAKATATQQKQLAAAQETIADALQRQSGELDDSKRSMAELAARQDEAREALAKFAAEARGPLQQAFNQQQSVIGRINNAYQANRTELATLSREMGRVGVPTREMVETYNLLLRVSAEVSDEYRRQQAGLAAMRTALREPIDDIDQLAAAQRRFMLILEGGAASLERVQKAARVGADANRAISEDTARTAEQTRRAQAETKKLGDTTRKAAGDTNYLAQALRAYYGESRTAMSLTQRLRGEVLALVSSYAGLYAVINLLGRVVEAYQALEAAQSRLNVVTEGDQGRAAEELDFVRRTAQRLGLEYASLAQEYSKFALATKGTNLEGEETRKIFVAVAEAARVNKVSMVDMAGTFVALTQIVSKGAVQMEELRQQLGDRLPGALQIMADGLGVTTAELIKMMEQGQVSSDALVGFAEELERRFGPQLENALTSATSQMGFFQNAITQTLLAFGEAGFMDAFVRLLQEMTEVMQSADFQAFVARLSQGIAGVVDVLTLAVSNWQLLAAAMTAVIGIRMLPVFVNLVAGLRNFIYTARGAAQAAEIVAAQTAAAATAANVATPAVGRLTLAMRALLSSTGIGLLLTVAATAFTLWATGATDASTAMERHAKVVDQVRNAYDKADKSNLEWAKRIEGLTVTEVRVALEAATSSQQNAIADLKRSLVQSNMFNIGDQIQNLVDRNASAQVSRLEQLIDLFAKGTIEVDEFKQGVSTIAEGAVTQSIQDMAEAILANTDAAVAARDQVDELEAVLRLMNGTASEADLVLLGLAEAAETAVDAFDPAKLEKFTEAMREMGSYIPGLKAQLETLQDLEAIDAAYQTAMANAQDTGDRVRAYNRREQAIQAVLSAEDKAVFEEIAKNTGVTQELFGRIFGEESYRGQAYDDGYGNPTIGFGSTTVNGKPVQMGDTITRDAAMREAVAELARLTAAIQGMVEVPLSDKQMQALVSYAYNAGLGSLDRDGIIQALNSGNYAGAQQAIRNGVDTSNGVYSQGLRDRREREADLFGQGMNDPAIVREIVELERERTQNAADFHEQLELQGEAQQAEIDRRALGIIQREQERALEEAQIAAREAGTELTQQEIDGILARTAAQYADQAQQEAENAVKEQRAAVEQKVNDLMTQRQALEEQLRIYQEQGNTEKAAETETAIIAINDQLKEAIANAIAMWEAIGGPSSAAAIAQLQTAALEANNLSLGAKKNLIDWGQVQNMFATGLTGAFMNFAQAVANGENAFQAAGEAFMKFASDFLIQIAQMIIQQAILNALTGFFGGGGGGIGGIFGGLFGTGHTGGVVGSKRIGSGNGTRFLNPAIFNTADRYHGGGVVGLKPGEVPAVLRENEEVLTTDDPRHIFNGGGSGSGAPAGDTNLKIVNAIDPGSFVDAGLSTTVGEKAFLNFITANSGAVRNALGV